jgi:hypothetical protein
MFLTNQEIFNKAYLGVIAQGGPSLLYSEYTDEVLGCAYRDTANNRKCGAGQLMLDEFYEDRIEGQSVGNDVVQSILIKSGVNMNNEKTMNLVQHCQGAHDNSVGNNFVEDFKSGMGAIAFEFELTIPDLPV